MIVAMHNVLRMRGGRLRLANLSLETDAMFELTRLRDVVEVYGTIEEAVSAVRY